MLCLRHPDFEVIVVNDGSNDDTLEQLKQVFSLRRSSRVATAKLPTRRVRGVYESCEPIRLVVIDKENGGKSDSLNAGLNYSRKPLVSAVDADSLLERDVLLQISRPFLEDPKTVAAGGMVRVANGCRVSHGCLERIAAPRSLLALFQSVEYLRAFLGGRVAFAFLDSLLLVSGAFGLFRKDLVVRSGGFSTLTVGEDMELVLRLHEIGGVNGDRGRIAFVPEPVCWTEVPESLRTLSRQRNRWQRGSIESLVTHRKMLFDRRWGVLGFIGMPYFVLFEVFGPVVEALGYVVTLVGLPLGLVPPQMALLFFATSISYGLLLTVGAILLEEYTLQRYPRTSDFLRLLMGGVLESFGYRQLACWWRLKGTIDWMRGKQSWGAMTRTGFSKV
jgi:cellulose synthase/poly-beta-1,6-N-acetylglucosamine synthase-like glycosyltransferase